MNFGNFGNFGNFYAKRPWEAIVILWQKRKRRQQQQHRLLTHYDLKREPARLLLALKHFLSDAETCWAFFFKYVTLVIVFESS